MTQIDSALAAAASGLRAQTVRMRIAAENIANADSTGQTQGADPFRRRIPILKTKELEDGVKGVAVVAFAQGEEVRSWTSHMLVVGALAHPAKADKRGDNLLAIAYTKASEMAETLKDSGHAGRAPYVGETGWQGGIMAKGKTGYLFVAFSGGPSEIDVELSRIALEILQPGI